MRKLTRFLYVSIDWTRLYDDSPHMVHEAKLHSRYILTIDSDSNSVDAPRNERVECHINPSIARESSRMTLEN